MSSRRNLLKTAALSTGAVLFSKSLHATEPVANKEKKLKILVAGAHPDDPETGAGGTICKYTKSGHEVVVVYLTRGEAGIGGVSHDEAAKIRSDEAIKASKILKTRSLFLGQIDGGTKITAAWYDKMAKILADEKPDMIFTHWPIDTHRDHRICSNLIYDAWNNSEKTAALYYFEVCTGAQTQNFHPSHFVNISDVIQQKWDACFVHKSQKIKENYPSDHAKMELFRGIECNADYAEAFIHHELSPSGLLP